MVLRGLRWIGAAPLLVLQGLGALLGWLTYLASRGYRRRLSSNAALAGLSATAIRRSVAHSGRMVGELPWLWLRDQHKPLGAKVRWGDGLEHLHAAVAAKRGIVLMSPHLGAFEICAQLYAERFGAEHPLTAMYRPARQPWLREVQLTARQRPGLLTAPASLSGIRQLVRALRKGDAVGLLPDQVPPDGMGVWVPWFGQDAYTMTLAARLIEQTGATALWMTARRLPWGRGFVVDVEPVSEPLPAAPSRSGVAERDQAADVEHQRACAAALNAEMQRLIQRMPEQYLWGYNRYKHPRRAAQDGGLESVI
jgi:Kdo2-lipid IVA lauroyltransferase/acyltransferase